MQNEESRGAHWVRGGSGAAQFGRLRFDVSCETEIRRRPCQTKSVSRRASQRACRLKSAGRSIDKIKRNRQLGKVAAKNVADYKWGLRQQSTSCELRRAIGCQLSAFGDFARSNIARVLALSAGYNGRTLSGFWRSELIMPHGSTRLGLFLFAVYLVLYGGFVLLAAFAPQAWKPRRWPA